MSMKEATVLGVIGGATALAIVGFTWGGWLTEITIRKRATQHADIARVMALTPLRIAKFNTSGDAAALGRVEENQLHGRARQLRGERWLGDDGWIRNGRRAPTSPRRA